MQVYLAGGGVERFLPTLGQRLFRTHSHGGLALRAVAFDSPRSDREPVVGEKGVEKTTTRPKEDGLEQTRRLSK